MVWLKGDSSGDRRWFGRKEKVRAKGDGSGERRWFGRQRLWMCMLGFGFPTSILDMLQELGRCGRGRHHTNICTDNFYLKVTLDDFVYLNQRLYLPQSKIPSCARTILSPSDTIKMQRSSILDMLEMVVLKGECWHKTLESKIGNPIEPPAVNLTSCGDACPVCCDKLSEYIMPISRSGLSLFLADISQRLEASQSFL